MENLVCQLQRYQVKRIISFALLLINGGMLAGKGKHECILIVLYEQHNSELLNKHFIYDILVVRRQCR